MLRGRSWLASMVLLGRILVAVRALVVRSRWALMRSLLVVEGVCSSSWVEVVLGLDASIR